MAKLPTSTQFPPGTIAVEKNGKVEIVYQPHPHQVLFHQSKARYTLMEGGRGSGKSLAIRMDAYSYCLTIPNFRALIVRRSMPELKSSHLGYVPMEAAKLGLPSTAWHATDYILRFPNGSTLRFGHVEDDNAVIKYLSSELEAIYMDELATFSLRQMTFLCSSLRSPIPGFVPFFKAGTNPVGPGATFVKMLFIDKNPPNGEDEFAFYNPDDYLALHSTMDDNPSIDRIAYDQILNQTPSVALRKALRHGEWTIEGQMFQEWAERHKETGRPWHVLEEPPRHGPTGRPLWEHDGYEVVRAIDWGYAPTGNPGICGWFLCLPDGSAIQFQEWVFRETLPEEAARRILEITRDLGVKKVAYTVGDTAMFAEHSGPSIAEKFSGAGLSMVDADKERKAGWIQVHTWLQNVVNDGSGPRPRLSFYRPGCPHTIRTIPQQTVNPKDPEDIISVGVDDDPADMVRYFIMSRPPVPRIAKPPAAQAWIFKEIAKIRAKASRGW